MKIFPVIALQASKTYFVHACGLISGAGGEDSAVVSCSFRLVICVDDVDLDALSSSGSMCSSSMVCASVAFGVDISDRFEQITSLVSMLILCKLVKFIGVSDPMLLLLSMVDLMLDLGA